MSKLRAYIFAVVSMSLLCHGQEKKEETKAQDKLTLEKARAALAESEMDKGLSFKPLFDLPKETKPEIIDTKLTYRKALAALKEKKGNQEEVAAEVLKHRALLAKMIGKSFREVDGKLQPVPIPPFTQEQYDKTLKAYEKAQARYKELKADNRVLYQKPPKKE